MLKQGGGSNVTDNFPIYRYCLQTPCIILDDTLPASIWGITVQGKISIILLSETDIIINYL